MVHRLLVVDDHVLFREGLCSVMSRWDDIEVVGEAATGEEAVEAVRTLSPDVVLMDIGLPGMDGIQATRLIAAEFPNTLVVILTMSEADEDLFQAIQSGAAGYLLKNTPSRRLHDELRTLLRGGAPFSSTIAAKILKDYRTHQGQPDTTSVSQGTEKERPALTPRDRELLRLVAAGLSNAQIGEELCLADNTIKKYVHNLMQKLQLQNRVEVATYALREGITDL